MKVRVRAEVRVKVRAKVRVKVRAKVGVKVILAMVIPSRRGCAGR